jgi:drug/metabolite transporter (DMT)-like permease
VIAAFAAVYIIWGSTYLAIRFAIETLPGFLMAGVRFVLAGSLILGWSKLRGARIPGWPQWRAAAITGTLLLLGGNGAVVWAERTIPSGVAALVVATVPCWMVLLDWLRPDGSRPSGQIIAGLLLGLGGIALLVGPDSLLGGGRLNPLGALALVGGSLSWATGSIYSRQARAPAPPLVATGMQMLCGGLALLAVGTLAGEWSRIELTGVSIRSLLALLYLILIGAIVGYTAYIWLLRVTTPARASTYAYVNPVVAVLLGWLFAGEVISARMVVAACIIIAGVALITIARRPRVMTGPSPATSGIAASDVSGDGERN